MRREPCYRGLGRNDVRLPRLQATLALGHWDRLELTGSDGRTVFLERDHEWYFERSDRVLGLVVGAFELIELDTAQIVAVRLHEHRPASQAPGVDPDADAQDHGGSEGGSDGDSA